MFHSISTFFLRFTCIVLLMCMVQVFACAEMSNAIGDINGGDGNIDISQEISRGAMETNKTPIEASSSIVVAVLGVVTALLAVITGAIGLKKRKKEVK